MPQTLITAAVAAATAEKGFSHPPNTFAAYLAFKIFALYL